MPVQDVKSTAARIRKGELDRCYYFYGADVVQVEALTSQLWKKATGSTEDLSITKYDGKQLELSQLEDAAQMFPMFSEYNCIWIHDLNAEQLREEDLKKLQTLCKELAAQTILLFSVTGFDVKDGKKAPTAKNKRLIDTIAKHGGVVCEAVQQTAAELGRSLAAAAQRHGCSMRRETGVFLAERCNGNTVRLRSELEKLYAYANGAEITRQMVEQLVSPSIETTVFALAKAVMAMRPAAAMAELDRLYAMRTSRTFIVHAIATAFLDLYRAAAAWRSNHTEEEMKEDFAYRFDFAVRNAFRDCRRIAPERLRSCVMVLRDLEQTLNTSSADERVLLEAAVVRMLEIASGREEAGLR